MLKSLSKRYWLLLAIVVIGMTGCGPAATASSEVSDVADEVVVEVIEAETETAVSAPSTSTSQTNPAAGDIVTENTYINLYEMVNPSVVEIRVVSQGSVLDIIPNDDNVPEDHPEVPGFEFPEVDPFPQSGQGSGFVYTAMGIL
jgi:hypothetical protein